MLASMSSIEEIEHLLPALARGLSRRCQPSGNKVNVQDDHVEAPLDRVGNAIIHVKSGLARLRHDRAIEATDVGAGIFRNRNRSASATDICWSFTQDLGGPRCFSSFRGVVEPYRPR